MTKRIMMVSALSLCVLGLSACDETKKQFDFSKKAPDEFAVVKRAPLELPPDYGLRPPRPGAPRPQELMPEQQARQTVFGSVQSEEALSEQNSISEGEAILLQKSGGYTVQPGIRDLVDKETLDLNEDNKPTVDRILEITGKDYVPPASVVDPQAETERIKKNKEDGKAINDGDVETYD